MEFKTPWLLILLIIFPLFVYFQNKRKKESSFRFPSTAIIEDVSKGWKARFYRLPLYLRWLAIFLLIIGLCGPRKVLDQTIVESEGIDIVLSLDVSGSMAAEDFTINGKRLNRLEAIKSVVKEFIDQRASDRLGLIVFGARAYTVCPLTTDYKWLKENLSRVTLGLVEDGTAIGSGIASGILRFKDSHAKSKIVILLTDGVNNAGNIDPLTAANMAKTTGVKIYVIGAGTNGLAPMPVNMFGRKVYQQVQVDLDEEPLKKIAEMTGAKYFRATDTDSLRHIYKDIDALEKTKITTKGYRQYHELFWVFVLGALGLLGLAIILENTFLFKIP